MLTASTIIPNTTAIAQIKPVQRGNAFKLYCINIIGESNMVS